MKASVWCERSSWHQCSAQVSAWWAMVQSVRPEVWRSARRRMMDGRGGGGQDSRPRMLARAAEPPAAVAKAAQSRQLSPLACLRALRAFGAAVASS